MIHIRIDDCIENSKRRFACGIGPELPVGDAYFFESESAAYRKSDCQGCNPGGPHPYGTPISQLSGQPGTRGFPEFCRIASSWSAEEK